MPWFGLSSDELLSPISLGANSAWTDVCTVARSLSSNQAKVEVWFAVTATISAGSFRMLIDGVADGKTAPAPTGGASSGAIRYVAAPGVGAHTFKLQVQSGATILSTLNIAAHAATLAIQEFT